ncbi:DUF5979 domain-containing protein [Microbacterium yannicii]|uniref:DUF5979 domain-containing protein n=1 Tax=Microbacterium yannicii TaxID=671622 RepID=UPI0002E0E3F8|nr:DUF5979 domain-containing protein [Microbacterium yannicii]
MAFPQQGRGETLNSLVVASGLRNPTVLPVCAPGRDPFELMVQMDLSGSVTELQRLRYRDAFTTMVEELAGLPIELSLGTFGSSSPVLGRESGPWSLDDPAEVAGVIDDIADFTANVPGATQQTNWDLALRRVAERPGAYDALLMLTDGAPNWVSDASGTGGVGVDGSRVTIASLEQAVFSANAVKAEGTRSLVMGIGNALAGDRNRNLAAISGPTLGSDFFQGDWDTLTDDVRAVVNTIVCAADVTVTKTVVDAAGQSPSPADGWSFSLDVSEVSAGSASIVGENPQLTGSGDNADGEASWSVTYSDSAAATLTLTEAPQDGFALVGASYTITHQDGSTTTGTGTETALSIPGVGFTDAVSVEFVNKAVVAPETATFQVRKVLIGDGADDVPGDTEFAVDYAVNGEPADQPLVITADGALVDGPELSVGDEVSFTEQTPPSVPGIAWGETPEISPIVLGPEPVIVEVTNVATPSGVTPMPTPTPTSPGGPDALPATGGEVSLVPIAAGGALLLVGAALVVAMRRRRILRE